MFTCGNFILIFIVFSIFWIGFFLNGYPNPIIIHSRPSFLFEPNFQFIAIGFLFTCCILTLIFWFFSVLGLIFVLSLKFFWIVRQDLSCFVFCFLVWRSFSFYICSHSKAEKVISLSDFFLSLTVFARVTSFLSLAKVLRSFAWLDFDHTWLTSLNNDFCTLKSLIWSSLSSKELICAVKVPNKRLLWIECLQALLLLNVFYLAFRVASIFQFRSVSVSISIIRHASLFFRSYFDNLPAMFVLIQWTSIGSITAIFRQ